MHFPTQKNSASTGMPSPSASPIAPPVERWNGGAGPGVSVHSKLESPAGSNLDWKGRIVLFMRFQSAPACLQESNGPSVSIVRDHRSLTEERFALRTVRCENILEEELGWRRNLRCDVPQNTDAVRRLQRGEINGYGIVRVDRIGPQQNFKGRE